MSNLNNKLSLFASFFKAASVKLIVFDVQNAMKLYSILGYVGAASAGTTTMSSTNELKLWGLRILKERHYKN